MIILHVSAQNWYVTDVYGFEWQAFNFFNSIVRWGVPVFTMISGALFLERDIPIKKIYSKYVFRMILSFAAWSVIYALFAEEDFVGRIFMLIQGHYHMWFILMIVGLYICIPFIKSIVSSEERLKYYIILAFVFAFVIPELVTLANDFAGELMNKGVEAINSDVNNMNIHIVLGYASYFVLGYYLNRTELSKKQRKVIYVLGSLGFAATICLNLSVALKTHQGCETYSDNFSVNVLFESVAVFTWFKYKKNNLKWKPMILKLSKFSFGAYLVHALILEQLNICFGLNTLSFHPVFAVLCIGAIVFVVSFAISALLNQVPIVKKYMV